MKSKKVHRGETLQMAVANSGLSITKVVKRAGYSRSSYYLHITDPELPFDILSEYGKAISYDFTEDFPDMMKYLISEEEENYGEPENLDKALSQLRNWKNKYYNLLEKYQKLLEEKLKK